MLQVNPVAAQIAPFGRYGRSPAGGRLADHIGGSARVLTNLLPHSA
jgi:hypothetical protein